MSSILIKLASLLKENSGTNTPLGIKNTSERARLGVGEQGVVGVSSRANGAALVQRDDWHSNFLLRELEDCDLRPRAKLPKRIHYIPETRTKKTRATPLVN